jgi:uncharacterized membrane protein YbaN (DUF454 family)
MMLQTLQQKPVEDAAATDKKPTKRVLLLTAGWLCIVVGAAGLVLPFVPGIVLLFAGLMLLAQHYAWARTFLGYTQRRFPKLWRDGQTRS